MPPDYDHLKTAFRNKTYMLTDHASDRAAKRKIRSPEIEQGVKVATLSPCATLFAFCYTGKSFIISS